MQETTNTEELGKQLLETTDQREVNDIINIFNTQLKKKEALRAQTYSDLQDKVTSEIVARLDSRSGEFTNKELLDFLTAFDNVISKSKVDKIDVPQIAIQQNINVDGTLLDSESRQKIQRYIQNILSDKEIVVNGTDTYTDAT